MKNDKERRAFVENDDNWKNQHGLNCVRVQTLEYRERTWYRVQVMKVIRRYEPVLNKTVSLVEWDTVAILWCDEEKGYFEAGDWTVPSIVSYIKAMDKLGANS